MSKTKELVVAQLKLSINLNILRIILIVIKILKNITFVYKNHNLWVVCVKKY